MSSAEKPAPGEWGERYRPLAPTYKAYAEKLQGLLCDLLDQTGIATVQTESRGKEVESFVGKIERKPDYDDPLVDVTDLAGVRIIAYYLEDVAAIGRLIRAELEVDDERSVQKGRDLQPDRFGYRSDHYIVRLGPSRTALGEWSAFADMVAEIQVRTATQHAWAAIEHRIGYKSAQLPEDIRRRLFRLSALFELADDQFSAIRTAAADVQQEYSDALRSGDLTVPLDTTSLQTYIDESPRVAQVLEMLEAEGATVRVDDDDRFRRYVDHSTLLEVLQGRGITILEGLDELLATAQTPDIRFKFEVLAAHVPDEWIEASPEGLLTIVAFLIWDPPRREMKPYYSEKFIDILRGAAEMD